MLKAVVFDFDGVIVDSEPVHYRAFLRAAQGIGVQFDYAQYLERYVGFDDRDGFRAILLDSKNLSPGGLTTTPRSRNSAGSRPTLFSKSSLKGSSLSPA